jgi:hypothetical protein
MEKRQPVQQILLAKLYIHMWKIETRSCLHPVPKSFKDLNIIPETLKQLQEVVGNTL